MELAQILEWIDRRKLALGIKGDAELERRAGAKWAVQNMRKGLRSGKFVPKVETLKKIADVLGEPPRGLFGPISRAWKVPTIPVENQVDKLIKEQARLRESARKLTEKADALDHAIGILTRKDAG